MSEMDVLVLVLRVHSHDYIFAVDHCSCEQHACGMLGEVSNETGFLLVFLEAQKQLNFCYCYCCCCQQEVVGCSFLEGHHSLVEGRRSGIDFVLGEQVFLQELQVDWQWIWKWNPVLLQDPVFSSLLDGWEKSS